MGDATDDMLAGDDADMVAKATGDIRSAVLSGMQEEVVTWCAAKGWSGPGAPPVSLLEAMALLHGEVSEAVEAWRRWGLADATPDHYDRLHGLCVHGHPRDTCSIHNSMPPPKPEGVGSEFADVLIRLLDDCDRFSVDLAAEFKRKMTYNWTRPFRHGGKRI